MVYESDFYTTRRPYSRPLASSYTVTGPTILPLSTVIQVSSYPHLPYRAHKRLVTFVHTPIHSVYHTGTPIPIRIHSRVRPSVLAAEYNRIRDLPRPSSRSYTERYLNSKDNIFFDDETRRIRARADSLLRRIHVFVPRPSASDFHEDTDPERLLSDDYIRRLLGARKNVRKEIESASWYAAPEQRGLGKGNLACVEYVGGRPHSRRRPYFKLADLRPVDIQNDVNLLSFYSKNRQAAANASPAGHLTEREIRKARAVEPERIPTSDPVDTVPEEADPEKSGASLETPEAPEPAAAIELEEIVGKKKEKKEKRKDKEVRKAADEEALRKAEEYLARQAEEARLEEERRLIAEEERLRLEREEEEARLVLQKAQDEARLAEIEEQERREAERREAEEKEEAARLEEERIAEEERATALAAEAAALIEEERQAAIKALEEEQKKREEEELLAAENAAAEAEGTAGSLPVEEAEATEETQQEQEEKPVETVVNEEPEIDEVEVAEEDEAVLDENVVQEPVEVEAGDGQPTDEAIVQVTDVPQVAEVPYGPDDNIWGDNEDA